MGKIRNHRRPTVLAIMLATLPIAFGAPPIWAASHREAPLIALDPAADNTDVYAFVSYDAANLARAPEDRKVTFVMNVIPGQDPAMDPITSISMTRCCTRSTSTTTR